MNTMGIPIVTTQDRVRLFGWRCAAWGAAMTVLAVVSIASLGYIVIGPAAAVVDERMEKACGTWPRYEGEALTVVVVGGKVVCWNMGGRR